LLFCPLSSISQPDQTNQIQFISIQSVDDNQIQKRDKQLFQMSQNYIRMNRYDIAIPALEDLLSRHPFEITYYDWLLRAYILATQYQKADSLTDIMSERIPTNPQFQIDKANVLLQLNEKETALILWGKIIHNNPDNQNVYNQVASLMIQNRLIDEAVSVYKEAIIQFPQVPSFYYNIGNLYKNQLRYVEAAEYYLEFLERQPNQRNLIYSKILSFDIEENLREDFFRILEEKSRKSDHSLDIKLLLAQLHQRYKEYDKALKIYQQLEDDKSQGARLLQFAQEASGDSSYQTALQAYWEITEKYPNSPYTVLAYKGAVSSLFHLAHQNADQKYARKGVALIDSIVLIYSNHPEISNLLLLKGSFYLDFYFDVDEAINIFSHLAKSKNLSKTIRNKSYLKLGECYLIKAQLEKAFKSFQAVTTPPLLSEAKFNQAITYYFQEEWEKCINVLQTIIQSEGAASVITNDALELQMKINSVKSSPDILSQLSRADFLLYQRKKTEALKEYINLSETISDLPLLKSDITLQIIQLSLELEEYPQALTYCLENIEDSTLNQYADKHLFLMANILENHLHRYQEAFNAYQKLLQTYPKSYYAARSRDRMRLLREEKLIEIP
jgi:tetratricopeptide (TPR) repeat protein